MPTRQPRRLTAILTPALLLAALGPGCSSSQSTGPSSATPNSQRASTGVELAERYEVDHDAWQTLGFRWEWTSRPPLATGTQLQYADAYDDLIFVQDTASTLSAIDTRTGKVAWYKQVRDTVTRFVGNTRQGNSYFVANETELFEFDIRTGNTLDRTDLGTIATTRPAMFGELAVLGTASGRLMGFDTYNDVRVWEYQFDGLLESPPIEIDNETVAAVSTTGELRVLDTNSARTRAAGRISGNAGGDMLSDGEYLYIGSLDQSVYAYDLIDGARVWRHRSSAPVAIQPTLLDTTLYATTRDDGLLAIDTLTGDTLWSNPGIGGWVVTTSDTDLLVWTGRQLLRVDADRGDVIARVDLPGISGIRSQDTENGEIYVISARGAVSKFSAR